MFWTSCRGKENIGVRLPWHGTTPAITSAQDVWVRRMRLGVSRQWTVEAEHEHCYFRPFVINFPVTSVHNFTRTHNRSPVPARILWPIHENPSLFPQSSILGKIGGRGGHSWESFTMSEQNMACNNLQGNKGRGWGRVEWPQTKLWLKRTVWVSPPPITRWQNDMSKRQ